MRILFATKDHLPIVGGAESTTHGLVAELQRRGHSTIVFAGQDLRRPLQRAVDGSLGYLTLRSAAPDRALPRVLKRFAPDVVVVGGYDETRVAWARSMLVGAAHLPTVLHLHDIGGLQLAAEAALRIDCVVAVSEFVARQADGLGLRTDCIPPPIDRQHYRVHSTRRVALFINPVAPKGVEMALALARARPAIPFVFTRCWHIAPGALATLEAQARSLSNVELRPATREPAQIYGDAKVLLVPSMYPEAWGRVASEAQMSGIPVLAANVGGLPEAVGEGGVLLDPGAGVETWSRTLVSLWNDEATYQRYVALAERQSRRADVAVRAVGDRFEALLRDVIERAQPGTRVRAAPPLP